MGTVINVTERQQNCAEKALATVMRRYAGLCGKRLFTTMPDMPVLEGVILNLPTHKEVIDLFVDNLENQASLDQTAEPDARAALLLARKIRKVTGCED